MHFIAHSTNLTPFRAPKPAISHLILFSLSPENVEKISKKLIALSKSQNSSQITLDLRPLDLSIYNILIY